MSNGEINEFNHVSSAMIFDQHEQNDQNEQCEYSNSEECDDSESQNTNLHNSEQYTPKYPTYISPLLTTTGKTIKKEDLYKIHLIKECEDYHGCGIYSHHTIFGLSKSLEEFKYYLSLLTPEEIICYEDEDGNNILISMADHNFSIEYFYEIINMVGLEEFTRLLTTKGRCGYEPITLLSNVETFKELLMICGINSRELRQLGESPYSEKILEYLADVINKSI